MAAARRRSSRRAGNVARTKPISDVVDLDEIARDFKLTTITDYDDSIIDSFADTWSHARKEALSEGMSEDEADEKAREAEQAERDEAVGHYMDAILRVADKLYGEHGLVLEPKHKGKGRSFEYKVAPEKSWSDAANKIRETINGVGMFEFRDLQDFLRSGPYTARQAVLSHLHWIADWPSVYGEGTPRSMVDRQMRHR